VILPKEPEEFERLRSELGVFREIYPTEFLLFFTPFPLPLATNLAAEEILYSDSNSVKVEDYRFKLVFNLTRDLSLGKHFLGLAALTVADLKGIEKKAKLPPNTPFSRLLTKVVLHAG
jgi:hypothetical protein